MTTRVFVLAVVALAGCGGGDDSVSKVSGSAKVGGKEAEVTGCMARVLDGQPAVFFTLDSGHTIVNPAGGGIRIGKGGGEPAPVECPTSSSNAAGGRVGGGAWMKGELAVVCNADGTEISLDVEYDCGAKARPSNEVLR